MSMEASTTLKAVFVRSRLPAMSVCVLSLLWSAPLWAQLDETWTVTVGGQTVQVNPDGTFAIPNIAAADLFGSNGPGSAPDFISDDFVQVIGSSIATGELLFVTSAPFKIAQGESFTIPDLVITHTGVVAAESIRITVDTNELMIGGTAQLVVTATLPDGSEQDITADSASTVYRTSNPDIVAVDAGGLVTAQAIGVSFITATNLAVTATKRIDVLAKIVSTTAVGFVQLDDATPVSGAQINTPFGSTISQPDGSFSVKLDVPVSSETLVVSATAEIDKQTYSGSSVPVSVVPSGFTDAGIIVLQPASVEHLFGNPEFVVGLGPVFVAAGDLDGDGDHDVVTANAGSVSLPDNTVSVLFSNGDVTFAAAVSYEVGENPRGVAMGDLDGDDDIDLAVANFENGVSILFSFGDGTFAPSVPLRPGEFPGSWSVAIGDVDGDGDNDLAEVDQSDNVLIYLNNKGKGEFGTGVMYAVGSLPVSVVMDDLDGDQDLDLVVANQGSDNVSVLLNDGDGTFVDHVVYGAGMSPNAVAVGDFDGVNGLDLAVSNEDSDDVSVLLNNGDGTFAPDVTYDAGDMARSVTISDLDGDDDLDLAVANWGTLDSTVSVFMGNGDGTFAEDLTYAAGFKPNSIAASDLDGDGDDELLTANQGRPTQPNNNMSVLLNEGDGTFNVDVPYVVELCPYDVEAADLDGDDDSDLAVVNFIGATLSVLLNDGDGTFAPQVAYATGPFATALAIVDVDGDVDRDLLVSNSFSSSMSILFNDGAGTFPTRVDRFLSDSPLALDAGDLDGDGDADVVIAMCAADRLVVLLNNGNATFGPEAGYELTECPIELLVTHLNEDDNLDVVVALNDGPSPLDQDLAVLLNNGDGTLAAPVVYDIGGPSVRVDLLAIGDLDGDGDDDVVAGNGAHDGQFFVLLNNGDGSFSDPVGYPFGVGAGGLAVGDLDGDGDNDVVITNYDIDNIVVVFNNGDGTFDDAQTYGAGIEPMSLEIADLDGDGDLDLAVMNAFSAKGTGTASILLNRRIP